MEKEKVDVAKCKAILNSWIDWTDPDVDSAKQQLRSMQSEKVISDDEYSYITLHWDELLLDAALPENSSDEDEDLAAALAEEIPDFPEQSAKYYVVVYSYDKDGKPGSYSEKITEWDDPDEAVAYANDLNFDRLLAQGYSDDVDLIELCVETIVNVDGDYAVAGCIFKRTGQVIKK